jgi:hypothetical protein
MKNGAMYKITAEREDGTTKQGFEFLCFTTARGRRRVEDAALNRCLDAGYKSAEVEIVGPVCSGF